MEGRKITCNRTYLGTQDRSLQFCYLNDQALDTRKEQMCVVIDSSGNKVCKPKTTLPVIPSNSNRETEDTHFLHNSAESLSNFSSKRIVFVTPRNMVSQINGLKIIKIKSYVQTSIAHSIYFLGKTDEKYIPSTYKKQF